MARGSVEIELSRGRSSLVAEITVIPTQPGSLQSARWVHSQTKVKAGVDHRVHSSEWDSKIEAVSTHSIRKVRSLQPACASVHHRGVDDAPSRNIGGPLGRPDGIRDVVDWCCRGIGGGAHTTKQEINSARNRHNLVVCGGSSHVQLI